MHALTLFTPSKLQHGFDSYHNGHYYFGIVQSNSAKRLPAIIVNEDSEQWHIVNLKHSNRFDAVAVLGAFDDDEATDIALQHYGNHFDAVASGDVCVSHTQGLKRYLDSSYANMGNRPVFKAEMDSLQSVLVGHRIEWDGIELKSHGGQCGNLLTDMVKHDDNRLLLEKYDGITAYLKELDDVELVEFDSFIVDNVRLEQTMNKLLNAMNRASGQGVQVRSFSQSKPVKLRQTGAIQVAVSFELVDGQNVTIVFNHADAETAKLGIKDALFAWKYKLNSRDISAAVQPNNAVDVKIDQIAIRIMKLANANSARFVRSQAKKDENKQALADGDVRISDKQAGIVALNTEIADLQKQIDEWQPSGVGEQSKNDEKRDELQPIENSPIVLTRDAVSEQMQKYSLQEYSALLAKRLEQLGLLEDYKESLLLGDDNKKSGDLMLVAAKDLQKTDGIISLLYGFRDTFNELRNMLKPIVLTGKELGDFPDTEEGKKALREKAYNQLVELANNGVSVFCKAINADVHFNKSGAKKFKVLSGDPKKIQLVAAIKDIISQGQLVKRDVRSYDAEEQRLGITYDILRTKVEIDGVEIGVRTVIRKLTDGKYQYDFQVKEKFEDIFDGVEIENEQVRSANKSDVLTHLDQITPQADNLVNTFDAVGDKYVLNLFIEGEDDVGIEQPEPPVENQPVEQPMNEQQADIDYLNSILSGEIDFATADLDELESKLEAINDRLTPETEPLFEQVADAFAAYAIALEV